MSRCATPSRGPGKGKRLPKYIPFRSIYEESDVSKLTFRQQLMVLKYREALSKAETDLFSVPDYNICLVYPSRGKGRRSQMDKSKELSSVETAKTSRCPAAAGIHVCVTENTSGVCAEDEKASSETEVPRDDENHSIAKPSVNTTIKCTTGTFWTQGTELCLARSGVQEVPCSGRLSHLEEAIFRALRYNK